MVLLTMLVGIAACQNATGEPPVSVEQRMAEAGFRDEFRPEKLRIGVYTWQPPMGYVDGRTSAGFDIDVARYIARNLGYDGDDKIEWVPLSNVADRIKILQQDRVDMVVASFSITPKRLAVINMAGPYLVTEQSVLIPTAMKGRIATIQDLKNPEHAVCTSTGSTSEALFTERKIPHTSLNSDLDCFRGLQKGKFQAISTDRTVLSGFVARQPTKLTLLDMKLATANNPGTERLGIGIAKGNPALRDVVDYFLNRSYQDQRRGRPTEWEKAYRQHLAQFGPATQPRPDVVPDLVDYDAKSPIR